MQISLLVAALIFGIVEGITEWLPISSTGHMILIEELIRPDVSEQFMEMFLVVIQLGAILAVPVIFRKKLFPPRRDRCGVSERSVLSLWGKVIVGSVPAAVGGVIFEALRLDDMLYNHITVAAMLIIYGFAFVFAERLGSSGNLRIETVNSLTYSDAIRIGLFQVLSLIPGTSRSGATILGGILCGASRTASSEFSFFMAIPIMLGASGLKIVKFLMGGFVITGGEALLLLVGISVSFLVSVFSIKFLMDFVKRHSFKPFGIYRIALGALVICRFFIK